MRPINEVPLSHLRVGDRVKHLEPDDDFGSNEGKIVFIFRDIVTFDFNNPDGKWTSRIFGGSRCDSIMYLEKY